MKPTNNFPSVVQFYGAKALYDSILARFEQISESTESVGPLFFAVGCTYLTR